MINVANKLMNAWYDLLNGNLSNSVPVYRYDAPTGYTGNYVLLRAESENEAGNNQRDVSNFVIITEVVTVFDTMIDDSVAGGIDSEISILLSDSPGKINLPVQDDISVTDIRRSNSTYIPEDDGVHRYLRIVTRNVHRVEQLILQS